MRYKISYYFNEEIEIDAEDKDAALKQAYDEMDNVISNNGVCVEVEEIDEDE